MAASGVGFGCTGAGVTLDVCLAGSSAMFEILTSGYLETYLEKTNLETYRSWLGIFHIEAQTNRTTAYTLLPPIGNVLPT